VFQINDKRLISTAHFKSGSPSLIWFMLKTEILDSKRGIFHGAHHR